MASNKTEKLELRVSPEFKEAVQKAAHKAGVSASVYTQQALIEKLYSFSVQTGPGVEK